MLNHLQLNNGHFSLVSLRDFFGDLHNRRSKQSSLLVEKLAWRLFSLDEGRLSC
jgi:hypothetical protein